MASSIELRPSGKSSTKLLLSSSFAKPVPLPKDLSVAGQTALITGATGGIGRECARLLLDRQLSCLIMAVRSVERGEQVAKEFRKAYPHATFKVWALDMNSYDSIQEFARKCDTLERLDFAILNAGAIKTKWSVNPTTGHEEMFQVNYLSTALLSILLLPVLKAKSPPGKPGRLTIVSSGQALYATFPNQAAVPLIPSFDDPTGWGMAAAAERYGTTKLIQQFFVAKLIEWVSSDAVVVNLVDPGYVDGTDLHRDVSRMAKPFFALSKVILARSLEVGATTYVDAAVVRGAESHGSFIMDWKIAPFGAPFYKPKGNEIAQRLWDETMDQLEFAGVRNILSIMKT